jgi:signal transduction histidine kinase
MQQVNAQPHMVDSLEKELTKSTNDSVNVFIILQLPQKYFLYDSAKAIRYLESGYNMAKKLKWDYVYGVYYEQKAIVRQTAKDEAAAELFYDSAIFYYQKSANAKRNNKETSDAKLSIATCKGMKGELLLGKQEYKEAIAEYMLAVEAWKNSDDPNKALAVGVYYAKISTVYYKLNQIDKALEYDKLSLALNENNNNEEDIAFISMYICDDFIRLHQMDSALVYLAKARPIVEKLNNFRLNIQYYNKLGSISRFKKDFKSAIGYYNKTLAIARSDKDQYQIVASQKIIGVCYKQMEDYVSARNYLIQALQGAKEKNYEIEKLEILQELVYVEKKTNHLAQAFVYLEELSILKDSSSISATKKAVAEIENKYKAAEKEKTIIQLENDKKIQSLSIRQKSTLNYFLIASLASLLIVGFLIYRNLRHRQLLAKQQDKLQQQLIRELEKDKQLVVIDSVLKGQENERLRLAKDLHDGLGGMLSGVKFSLMNMKNNLIISHKNAAVFERSLDMLDTSIQELRRVAHNMMPESLVKFGLDDALKDYCNNLNSAHILNVEYQSFGLEQRLESNAEIIIYRIIQELLNNIFKHAKASEVLVQLFREGNRVNITVEDNGKGFDIEDLKKTKGAGWANIRSRIDYLKGKLDLHSDSGLGTSVNIEINFSQ